jgi:hypothetical protein
MSSARRRAGLPAACYRLFLLLFAPFYQVGYLFFRPSRHHRSAAWDRGYDTIMAILAASYRQ